jgi:hypothetical protein
VFASYPTCLYAFVISLVTCGLVARLAIAADRYSLSPKEHAATQVRVVIEVEGELKANADGKEVQRLPLSVTSEQQYAQRRVGSESDVRFYKLAEAKIRLGKVDLAHELRSERKHVVVAPTGDRPTIFSPLGPLTREELELLETPASLTSLAELLPADRIAVGTTWDMDDKTLARMLCLDIVHQSAVTCKLVNVEDGIATVSMSGKGSGSVEGVSSDVELIAKYNFDLKRGAITWLALAIRENRAVGHAQPGFETVTKLRLVSAPADPPAELSDVSLVGLTMTPGPGERLLELKSERGGYELLHDRRWRVMVDRHDTAIMRLVDLGDLIAQCNVSKLAKLPKGEQLTLEGFQADVEKTLGKNFGQVVEASQQVTEMGVRVLRVVVSGNASDLPMQWCYYHLSDEQGNRVSLVMTMEANLVERFPTADRELISGFRFLPGGPTLSPSATDRSANAKPENKPSGKR